MNIIRYIIQKEFKQIFRNKAMLPIIFVLPLIQLIILSNAATFEVKNIKFAFVDNLKLLPISMWCPNFHRLNRQVWQFWRARWM